MGSSHRWYSTETIFEDRIIEIGPAGGISTVTMRESKAFERAAH
jgi:hypothetical protein